MIRAQLRRLRIAAGLSQEEFGKLVHYSNSAISAVELGQRPLDKKFLARADEVLNTGGLLLYLAGVGERDGQPSWFRPWLEAERTARQLRCFEPILIPGLLQTAAYARAVLRCHPGLSEDEVEHLLAGRLERQEILTGDHPPQFVAVIDAAALRRTGEGFETLMAEQLQHLIACADLPGVSVHIVPDDVVLHVGLSGAFALARSAEGGWVGHMENQLGGSVVDREDDITTLLATWESVRNEALSRRQSIELIKEVMNRGPERR